MDGVFGTHAALQSMTLLVAAVIVHDKATNRLVLLQRSQNAKFAQGMWDLPVGKSEPGEPITQTAVRELHEETGLTVKPESLKVAHIIHGAWGVEAPNGFLTVVFTAREWTGEPENREPRKHAQVRWIDADKIPDNFVDTTSSALHRYLSGGPVPRRLAIEAPMRLDRLPERALRHSYSATKISHRSSHQDRSRPMSDTTAYVRELNL